MLARAGALMTLVFGVILNLTLAAPDARGADPGHLVIETASGARSFSVEIADTPRARELGLMFRTTLSPDAGMLFDFHDSEPVAFWMKNTLIPLDMLFIRADGRIANIRAMATPGDLTPIPSAGPVQAVLELAGGTAARLGIKAGDRVRHPIFP